MAASRNSCFHQWLEFPPLGIHSGYRAGQHDQLAPTLRHTTTRRTPHSLRLHQRTSHHDLRATAKLDANWHSLKVFSFVHLRVLGGDRFVVSTKSSRNPTARRSSIRNERDAVRIDYESHVPN